MPEFQLNTGSADMSQFDEFTTGYIEVMFFADIDYPDAETYGACVEDLAPEAVERIKADCAKFQADNDALLFKAITSGFSLSGQPGPEYNMTRAGSDYWYTRQGHGVGYWDRGLGEVGDELTEIAQHNEILAYQGDDGQIHLS